MKDFGSLPKRLQSNPFFHFCEKSNFVPAWDKIRPIHAMPALDYALTEAENKITAIIENRAAPTFSNTIEALERADELAGYFAGIIFNIVPRNAVEEKQYDWLFRIVSESYLDYYKSVFSNEKLYARICKVRRAYNWANMPKAKLYLLESYENGFKDAGINLPEEVREEFYDLEQEIAALEITSQRNMARAESDVFVYFKKEKVLDGLPLFALRQARQKAIENGHRGQLAFSLDDETYSVFLSAVHCRRARERMYCAFHKRASSGKYDNRDVIIELNRLYQRRARMLGYRSVADMELRCNMALKPGTVGKFLKLVRKIALPVAHEEHSALKEYARDKFGIRAYKPWDALYVSERMKKDLLGFDEEELRPYFELETVLEGAFNHFKKLYGIRFKENNRYPVYHKDVRAFDVLNSRSGRHLGVLFLDLYARKQKPAGVAWSVPIVMQGLFQDSIAGAVNVIVTKLAKPRGGTPTLLTHDDVQTLFHELGHATHDILSDVRYPSQAGTNVENDFLEFPSQIEENWTYEPEVLSQFAFHYKTGEPMPDELMEKIAESRSYMAASRMLADARKAWLDLAWAEANNSGKIHDVAYFEKKTLRDFRWAPRYGEMISPSFSHIFGGGYEMSYYGYQWAEALAADAYKLFEQKGLYNREMASRLKKLKQQGGSKDSGVLYREFRRRCATMTSFFTRLGLMIRGGVTMDMLYSPRRTAGAAPATFHKRRRLSRGRYLGN